MSFTTWVRRGHPVLFGLIIFLAIVEGSLATWLTVKYNAHHDYPNKSTRDTTRFLVFASWWTVLFSFIFAGLFFHSSNGSVLTSVASHGIFLFLTWIFWTAGAAAITQAIGGGNDCSKIGFNLPYCNQLNAELGFGWAVWLCVTVALIVVIARAVSAQRRGDGMAGQLV